MNAHVSVSPALSTPSASAGGLLTIDLAALRANYRLLREEAGGAAVAGVVKADGYGLGARKVAWALWAEGCRSFFVALLSEALELRASLPAAAEILVLNGLSAGSEAAAAEAGVVPVLNSLEQVRAFAALGRARGKPLPAAIQLDSGMSRLGLSPGEVDALTSDAEALAGLDLVLVMSHLACADETAHPANAAQLAAFEALSEKLPSARRSLANSAGIFLGARHRFDLVRPGIALYGGSPVSGRANPMQPVVTLEARVAQLREVPAGAGIGYGFTAVSQAPKRLATIGIGYADGWPRMAASGCAAFFRGVRLPIIGRVSMDSIVLDATHPGADALAAGDLVELIGAHQSLEDVAVAAGTISYEILTSLGRRFERRVLNETAGA